MLSCLAATSCSVWQLPDGSSDRWWIASADIPAVDATVEAAKGWTEVEDNEEEEEDEDEEEVGGEQPLPVVSNPGGSGILS